MKAILCVPFLAATIYAGSARAVALNPNGIGTVLLYPYYTVNKGQDTLITVVNPGQIGAIATVRFNEGQNGRQVLAFDLYLGSNDVWTAAISQTSDNGGAKLTTADNSCTIPEIPAEGLAFSSAYYDGSAGAPMPADAWPHTIQRTREGSIEIIVGAQVIPNSPTDLAMNHSASGAPDCASLTATPASDDVQAPVVAGLSGSGAIINGGEGTFFSYVPEAIAYFSTQMLYPADRGPLQPSLAQANNTFGQQQPVYTNLWSGQTLTYEKGIDAISAVLMADSLSNEYLVSSGLGAQTDWVVSFPTKAFYTDSFYTGAIGPRAPFSDPVSAGRASVEATAAVFTREQSSTSPNSVPLTLPYQVNVLSFRSGATLPRVSGVLGSTLVSASPAQGDAGWMQLTFGTYNGTTPIHVLTGAGIDRTAGATTPPPPSICTACQRSVS